MIEFVNDWAPSLLVFWCAYHFHKLNALDLEVYQLKRTIDAMQDHNVRQDGRLIEAEMKLAEIEYEKRRESPQAKEANE